MEKGKIIMLDKLYFLVDSFSIISDLWKVLNEVFEFFKMNKDVVIEIGGYMNDLLLDDYCFKLFIVWVKLVVEYFINRGINCDRLEYKGYGKIKLIVFNKIVYG